MEHTSQVGIVVGNALDWSVVEHAARPLDKLQSFVGPALPPLDPVD
jgi:phosphoribosylcarboxyaminoimidazole (NCAIR) mutase